MKNSINNRRKIELLLCFIVICLIIITAAIYKNHSDVEEKKDIFIEKHIQYFYGVSRYLNILDRCGQKRNEKFVADLKEDYSKVLEKINLDDFSSIYLVRVIYINSILGMDNSKYLTMLSDYYDSENKIISSYPVKYVKKENYDYDYNATNTIDFWDQLINSNVDVSSYELEEGIIEFYYKTDDEQKREKILETFIKNRVDAEIDYSLVKPSYEQYYNNFLEYCDSHKEDMDVTFDDLNNETFFIICEKAGIDVTKGREIVSNWKLTIDDEGFDMITGNGDTGCVLMSSWLWDDLVNDTGLIVTGERFWNKMDELYTNNYYNEVRNIVLKDLEGK